MTVLPGAGSQSPSPDELGLFPHSPVDWGLLQRGAPLPSEHPQPAAWNLADGGDSETSDKGKDSVECSVGKHISVLLSVPNVFHQLTLQVKWSNKPLEVD